MATVALFLLGLTGALRHPSIAATAGALALATLAVCFVANWIVSVHAGLCGHGLLAPLRIVAMLAAFALGPALGRRGGRWLLVGWPVAIVLALGLTLALSAVVPGTHGYCET
jgi:hypothetical protein